MSTNTKEIFDGTYKNNDGSIEYVKGKKVTTIDHGQSSTIEYTDEELKKYFGNKKKIKEPESSQSEKNTVKAELPESMDFFDEKGIEDRIIKRQEDVWIKNIDKQSSLDLDETLTHTFENTTVRFGIRNHLSEGETTIIFGREPDGTNLCDTVNGNFDTAKMLVDNVIKHFDKKQDMSILDIHNYLKPQIMELQLAKKAGYVQGVCECVAAIGEDHILGKKLLTEMRVTKDMAKKYASPETYKALEQGIFAPRQKIEQSQSIKL